MSGTLERHDESKQLDRRALLARIRNFAVSTALRDEDAVLWTDCGELSRIAMRKVHAELLSQYLKSMPYMDGHGQSRFGAARKHTNHRMN